MKTFNCRQCGRIFELEDSVRLAHCCDHQMLELGRLPGPKRKRVMHITNNGHTITDFYGRVFIS